MGGPGRASTAGAAGERADSSAAGSGRRAPLGCVARGTQRTVRAEREGARHRGGGRPAAQPAGTHVRADRVTCGQQAPPAAAGQQRAAHRSYLGSPFVPVLAPCSTNLNSKEVL